MEKGKDVILTVGMLTEVIDNMIELLNFPQEKGKTINISPDETIKNRMNTRMFLWNFKAQLAKAFEA